jgi:hypothetical protein
VVPGLASFYTDNMIENDILIAALIFVSVVSLLLAIIVHFRSKKTGRILRSIIESRQEILLFYDEDDNLVFHSAGLVLFNKGSLKEIRKLEHRPLPDREVKGELTLDGNRYRTVSKLLQYKPGAVGTIVYLEYLGSENASK